MNTVVVTAESAVQEKKDWASPRLRGIIEKAAQREMVWRDIKLTDYNPELLAPDGGPQTLEVWANAPAGLMDFIRVVDWDDPKFYDALAEVSRFSVAMFRDLFDAWEPALKIWVMREIFDVINKYRDERLSFLESLRKDSMTNNSPKSE